MPKRAISQISSAIASVTDAHEFAREYNDNATGCYSAEVHDEADDRLPIVIIYEHDTEAEARAARGRGASLGW